MVDGELVTVHRKKKDKKSSGSVSTNNDVLNSSFSALATDPPPPCKICETVIDDGKSIRCDKCVCWVHQDCSNLSKTDFAFLDKAPLALNGVALNVNMRIPKMMTKMQTNLIE